MCPEWCLPTLPGFCRSRQINCHIKYHAPEFFLLQKDFFSTYIHIDNSQHRLLHPTQACILLPLSIAEERRQLPSVSKGGSDLWL